VQILWAGWALDLIAVLRQATGQCSSFFAALGIEPAALARSWLNFLRLAA